MTHHHISKIHWGLFTWEPFFKKAIFYKADVSPYHKLWYNVQQSNGILKKTVSVNDIKAYILTFQLRVGLIP